MALQTAGCKTHTLQMQRFVLYCRKTPMRNHSLLAEMADPRRRAPPATDGHRGSQMGGTNLLTSFVSGLQQILLPRADDPVQRTANDTEAQMPAFSSATGDSLLLTLGRPVDPERYLVCSRGVARVFSEAELL